MKNSIVWLLVFLLFSVKAGFAGPQRILPMAPNLVETVFALGAGDLVVGIPEYTIFPPEALHLPSAGGYFNPNLERIAVLRPDLVLVQGRHERLQTYCQRMRIPVLALVMEDRISIEKAILTLGQVLDKENEARALTEAMNRDLEALRQRYAREKPVKVLLVLGRTPGTLSQVMTAGKETYLTELLSLVGGENIFSDQEQRYPTVSKEAILVRGPEMILEFLPGESAFDEKALLGQWRALGPVPAVRHGRIVGLKDSRLLLPGPRIAEAAALFGDVLEETMAWKD
ncbi:helical backbone metal receptor [Desulfobotulus sp.]|uniref:ABC transporter substrate-binding protein n=1 Tax=Desulfobotulus sp. TaxID=1940337 RepID=UPI002A35FE69|nr:helical backbone metal receptor [Desulfobotulus sp.]MDY0162924.1 helical backbone metal receptor [Desulfobotulus sp.]